MDINPQTREVSVEEWWAANHGSDQDVAEIGFEELLGMAESLGLTPSQMAAMGLLGANYRDRVDATRQLSTASETLGRHFVRHSISPSVENQTYGSNEEVYNPYNPQASTAYLAQEVAAGRREPAGLPQRSPRASRKPQELATGSLPRSSSQETIFPSSPRNDIFDWNEHGNALSLVTPDSGSSTEGSSGSHRSDALPYLFDDYRRSSPLLGRRVHAREAGPDSESEDQYRPDHAALASIHEPEEHDLSSDYIRTPEMDYLRPQRAKPPDLDARAKELVLGIASRIHTPPTATASTPTHQPANGAPGSAGLVDHDRKRRRTDRSPQEAVPPPPIPGAIGTARTAARQAFFAASDWPGRSRLRAEAPVFVPRSARTTSSPPLRGQAVDVGRIMLEHLRMNIDRHRSQQPPPAVVRQTSAAMFLPAQIPMRHLVFTSELIPASLGEKKRRAILNILRIKAPYVPACIAMPPMRPKIQYHISLKPKQNALFSTNRNNAPLGSNGQGWPVAPYGLPLEVFQNIAGYLPRSSLESMRLVSREFERNVSNVQFRRVVVPFRPEIYDIIDPRGPFLKVADVKGKGKGKEEMPLKPDETTKAVHDGMRVFEAWGSEVREFAMAFEVPEDQLVRPPVKGKFEVFDAFFGSYKWPHPDYRRFELLCGLEKKADEHRYMSTALSNLRGVQVLGICIDNGLGWLSGSDISDHAQAFKQKTTMFGPREPEMKEKLSESEEMWKGIVGSLRPEDGSNYRADGEMICHGELPMPPNEHGFYQAIVYPRRSFPHVEFIYHPNITNRPLVFQGINIANAPPATLAAPPIDLLEFAEGNKESAFTDAPLVPSKLTTPQKEWLMETEWAQRAFLSSYCMALTDNSLTFQNVHTLNIAKLSSKHLAALERDDFWNALPALSKLIINVAADFRAISKNDSGEVVTDDIDPSGAAIQFFRLVDTYISKVESINTMSLGYSGGGERQTGIYGRNKLILPAPLADYTNHNAFGQSFGGVLSLPHVRYLTLTNCWIAPPILKTFVSLSRGAELSSLTLDSVSLSAHSGVSNPTQPDPLQNGVYASPVGHPLRFVSDLHLGNFFAQRDSYADPAPADPGSGNLNSWVGRAGRVGSWADVIDSISPGPTLDLIRYAFRYLDDLPPRPKPGPLEVINFISCGYVRLVNQPPNSFDQSSLPEVANSPPPCLQKRALDLMPVMMHRRNDQLLGQIVPALPILDESVFETGFPMTVGWPEGEGLDALEDGQPLGGEGRFTGRVERLLFGED